MNNEIDILQLEPRQKALFQKLTERTPILAKIYLGALYVLNQVGNPDRFSLTAHNLRELMEKMPLHVDIRIKLPQSLGEKIRQIHKTWKSCGPLPITDDGFVEGFKKVVKFFKEINSFFDWYENHSSTRQNQIKEVIRKLDPANRPIPKTLEDINSQLWENIRDFFLSIAHHNKETNEEEFFGYLYYLENFLLERLKPRTFEDIEEIDTLIGTKVNNAK